ncbi:hypothetical protein [Streptomyces sp. NPDC127190]|uniref:hypothetical protein n=1 Tax=unclassified Streptomyces TaxID=2593676 RepID=UPI00363B5FB3
MPRGRHRHSPPLHRLLPPSAIAGVSIVCALGPWVVSEAAAVRALAAVAAVTAVTGAFVMRRWDIYAGKQVADLTRARAGDEWRFEERVAELEADLEESRELRAKLEQRLRAKRAELAGLRNEHAALLRRYATAETERASALEGRRRLEIEAAVPALPPARSSEKSAGAGAAEGAAAASQPESYAVFSPEGSRLYLRALTALARFGGQESAGADAGAPGPDADAPDEDGPDGDGPAGDRPAGDTPVEDGPAAKEDGPAAQGAAKGEQAAADMTPAAPQEHSAAQDGHPRVTAAVALPALPPAEPADAPAPADDAAAPAEGAKSAGQAPAGHLAVPTAVAVVPATPARRPVAEGGFDFFGTQKSAPKAALDSVQNEDLADVVGQEALAVHKAEAEAAYKAAGPQSPAVGQVIDLTAHDETEQIDVQRLRSAAS